MAARTQTISGSCKPDEMKIHCKTHWIRLSISKNPRVRDARQAPPSISPASLQSSVVGGAGAAMSLLNVYPGQACVMLPHFEAAMAQQPLQGEYVAATA